MNHFRILIFALAITVFTAACSKDDSSNNPSPSSGNTMAAKIDGSDWSGSLTVSGVYSSGVLAIAGQDDNVRQIQIRLLNPSGTGDYPIGGTATNPHMCQVTMGTTQNDMYTTMIGVGNGTVTLTKLSSTEAEGTFSFTARNMAGSTKSVTGGSFKVKF